MSHLSKNRSALSFPVKDQRRIHAWCKNIGMISTRAELELRRSRRFRLVVPVSFFWTGPDGSLQEEKAFVRDIGSAGVFITAEDLPPVGARLDVDVYLPLSEQSGGGGVQLHGEGTVVRIEQNGNNSAGFAAELVFQTEVARGSLGFASQRLQ